jgi:LysM repeat protein
MNSIRPLVTITILVVVGAFLYVKINQGPVRAVPEASDAWPEQAPAGVPPLSATTAAAPPSETPAPPWSASAGATEASATTAPSNVAAADATVQQQPVVPAIPAMPEVTSVQQTPGAAAAAVPLPTELPANIPTANYSDQPATNGTAATGNVGAPATAASATSPPIEPANPTNPPASTAGQAPTPATPEQANRIDLANNALPSPPLTAQENPLRQSAAPAEADRYAAANPAVPLEVETPAANVEPSFATSWPTIQAALDEGELARAHELLSRWHNDPTLTPTDAELVDTLLSQLAGTVIYSTEHQLEPPYVVKQGETLQTIAKQYDVPWQLLAKINGVAAADQVRPGRELKVVRGPFSAVVDLDLKQLTLMVGERYAGKFPVTMPSVAAVREGRWIVDQKLAAPAAAVVQSAYAPEAASVDRAIVLRSDPSGGEPSNGAGLMITSSGASAINAADGLGLIHVSRQDVEELSDILSIGSRVVIQR